MEPKVNSLTEHQREVYALVVKILYALRVPTHVAIPALRAIADDAEMVVRETSN